MSRKQKQNSDRAPRILKRSTLIIALAGIFVASVFLGTIAGARGLGSVYPQINLSAQPFACPGRTLTNTQQISEMGNATYYGATWYCVDPQTGERSEADPMTVYLAAGLLHGLVIFAILVGLAYVYWNSSMGPAKNDGVKLW